MTRYTDYDPFAWVYNRHFGTYTLRFCPILEALVLPELAPHAPVMDLCCGTGQLARWLTERGYSVTGIDGSEAMLHFARENAPEASFVLADARSFTVPSTFHAVVSTSDSLNHLLSLEELTAAFRNVYTALIPGGVFLCDMNTHEHLPKLGTGEVNTSIVEDDHAFIMRTRYDTGTRLAYWDLTLFRLQNSWERADLTLIQRGYEETEICQALVEAGFSDARVFDAARCPEGLASLPCGRAFFMAWKEQP
ncbi:MAG TPA: class I SAM-dependent methyltransferase [Armatimonadota bacterium]